MASEAALAAEREYSRGQYRALRLQDTHDAEAARAAAAGELERELERARAGAARALELALSGADERRQSELLEAARKLELELSAAEERRQSELLEAARELERALQRARAQAEGGWPVARRALGQRCSSEERPSAAAPVQRRDAALSPATPLGQPALLELGK